MSYEVQIRRAAELDVAEAQVWYDSQRSGLGDEFQAEVSLVIDRLADTPLIYQFAYKDIRRALVPRFPYLIWYRVMGEAVVVLACTHAKQDPGKATVRLK